MRLVTWHRSGAWRSGARPGLSGESDAMLHPADRQTGRPADRQTGRPADRQTGRPADRQTGRPADRQTGRPADRQTGRPADRQTGRPADRQTGRPADRQTGRPADRQTGRPADRQTGRPADVVCQPSTVPAACPHSARRRAAKAACRRRSLLAGFGRAIEVRAIAAAASPAAADAGAALTATAVHFVEFDHDIAGKTQARPGRTYAESMVRDGLSGSTPPSSAFAPLRHARVCHARA